MGIGFPHDRLIADCNAWPQSHRSHRVRRGNDIDGKVSFLFLLRVSVPLWLSIAIRDPRSRSLPNPVGLV